MECFGGRHEGKRLLARPRRRWEDITTIGLQEVGCGRHGMDRSGSVQGQAAGACESDHESSASTKCGEFPD